MKGGNMLSLSKDITEGFSPLSTENINKIASAITKSNWSCGTFKDGHRRKANFEYSSCIALDVDNDPGSPQMSLEQAKIEFKDMKHIIATSRSHQKKKGDRPPVDRFRVLLFLEEPIKTPEDFQATYEDLLAKYPAIDPQCKDASRFYYPSPAVVSVNDSGGRIMPVRYKPKKLDGGAAKTLVAKGKLAQSTYDFILHGAPDGTWNNRLMKASIDMKEQGYSLEEAVELLTVPTRLSQGELDEQDLRTIEHQFSSEETRYEPRGGTYFTFLKPSQLRMRGKDVKWLIEDLLFEGSFNILSGPPKQGKTTLVRQLMRSAMRGTPFLGRRIHTTGPVLYLALEDHPAMVAKDLETLGIGDNDPILIHCDPVRGDAYIEQLERTINAEQPKLVVIDTFPLFARVENLNDYSEVNRKMEAIRAISRNTGTTVLMVHHTNKGEGSGQNKIMGSQAIFGAVDCSILFSSQEGRRFISSEQRGGTPLNSVELIFNHSALEYSIKMLAEDF